VIEHTDGTKLQVDVVGLDLTALGLEYREPPVLHRCAHAFADS